MEVMFDRVAGLDVGKTNANALPARPNGKPCAA